MSNSFDVTLNAIKTRAVTMSSPDTSLTPGAKYSFQGVADAIFLAFTELSDTYQYDVIDSLHLALTPTSETTKVSTAAILDSWSDPTYRNQPDTYYEQLDIVLPANGDVYSAEISYRKQKTLRFGARVSNGAYEASGSVYTSLSTYKPKLIVTFTGEKVALYPTGIPVSGSYQDPTNAIYFRWTNSIGTSENHYHVNTDNYKTTPTQTAAVVTIREQNSGTVIHQEAVTTSTSYTLPANTLSINNLYEWKVAVTSSSGETEDTGWLRLTTTESTPSAPTSIAPDGDIFGDSQTINFQWTSVYSDFDIRFSDDGVSWGSPISVSGLSYQAAAADFSAGAHYWQVRAYNTSVTPSAWTASKSFVVVKAPDAPVLFVTSESPKPEFTWEGTDQQAYQIQIGDYYDSGLVYGTGDTFKSPVYIPDGNVTARLRIMNQYNLWSEWSQALVTITNTPGTAPVLTVTGGSDMTLTWTGTSSETIIFRDGQEVARVTGQGYIDKYAANGEVTYFVRSARSSDNYADSNTATAVCTVPNPMICKVGGQWINLRLVTVPVHSVDIIASRTVDIAQYAYDTFPTAEAAPFRSEYYQLTAAFVRGSDSDFADLLGEEVVVKDQYGTVIHGIMSSMNKSTNQFYVIYTATIQKVEGDL